jgi:hypothetical protein
MWSSVKIPGYNTRRKVVVMHNNKPILTCDSLKRAAEIIAYAEGYEVEIPNIGIKKLIDKELNGERMVNH